MNGDACVYGGENTTALLQAPEDKSDTQIGFHPIYILQLKVNLKNLQCSRRASFTIVVGYVIIMPLSIYLSDNYKHINKHIKKYICTYMSIKSVHKQLHFHIRYIMTAGIPLEVVAMMLMTTLAKNQDDPRVPLTQHSSAKAATHKFFPCSLYAR